MADQTSYPVTRKVFPGRQRAYTGLLSSRPARIACIVVGTAGLAALAVALVGPGRVRRSVMRPLHETALPQAERLWAQSEPLRAQLARLMKAAPPAARASLARNFQSWIGHFHAS